MPNLQHQNLRREKHQIYNIKICVRKKTAKFTTSKFTWEKKSQIYNIKIYVRKKNAKFTTWKFTWEKKRQIYNKIYVRKALLGSVMLTP